MKLLMRPVVALAYKNLRQLHKVMLLLFLATATNAQEITIAAFGDSLTAGYGLASDEGFAPQLEIWLQQQGADVRVLNAGVSGDTTAMGLARLDWVLGPDVDAVILELGANDFLRGLSPAEAASNLDKVMQAIALKNLPVLLAGLPAPSNYGADYKQEFDAIYPDLAARYESLYYPHFMNGIASQDGNVLQFIQPDGLHPNAAGVLLMVEDIGPLVMELLTLVPNSP